RLPQESNPTPGRYPGFVASHDTTGNEDYRPTSPDNPLPTSNYIQRESGVWVPISKDNPMPTQLTGSKVEKDTILSRTIIDNSHHIKSYNISAPNNATGFIIYLRVFGVTGSFEEGQGLYLSLFEGDLSNQFLMRMDTAKTTEAKGFTIYRYPLLRDDVLGDMRRNTSYSEGFYYSGLPISRNQRLYTYIT